MTGASDSEVIALLKRYRRAKDWAHEAAQCEAGRYKVLWSATRPSPALPSDLQFAVPIKNWIYDWILAIRRSPA